MDAAADLGAARSPSDGAAAMSNPTQTPPHPGSIVFENRVDGTQQEQRVDQVPADVAFVELDGQPVPVVRVVFSAFGDQRRIESFGVDGRLLSVTVASI